jgi:hypothetical protein
VGAAQAAASTFLCSLQRAFIDSPADGQTLATANLPRNLRDGTRDIRF